MQWLKHFFQPFFKSIEPDPMKYLIVGLGNPGPEYDHTRHNIGFDVLDHLSKQFEVKWKDDRHGYVGEFKYKGRTFVLLKPNTFMNLSGKAVHYWMQKHKILVNNLLVIVDDLNLDLGNIRLKGKGSDGGHNGLKDINQTLGGNKYARLRIGIGRDFAKGQQSDYVLGRWEDEEKEKLPNMLKKASEIVLDFGSIGLQFTMNKHHTKNKKGSE